MSNKKSPISNKIPSNVGKLVREVRTQLGYKQYEFSRIMGVRPAGLSDIENCKKNPSQAFWAHFKYRYLEKKDQSTDAKVEIVQQDTPSYKPKIDVELHRSIIIAVENYLASKKLTLPVEKKAEVIALLYELYYISGQQLEEETVKRYLKLVA